jgi:hypothetical protein
MTIYFSHQFRKHTKLQDNVSLSWDEKLMSEMKFTEIDEPCVSSLSQSFEAEAKWYPSVLSALLCQQGFLFDSLGQNDNAKVCFEAACRMLPVHEKAGFDTYEPFMKTILRNRISASKPSSALNHVPDSFEQIPGLQRSFNDLSALTPEINGFKYMNISGWLAFCAKYKFRVYFPSLIRSTCISCFMECAKQSYGNMLLLSFEDFCSCLVMLQHAGANQIVADKDAHFSAAANVKAVSIFLQTVEFFALIKRPVQRKCNNLFPTMEESGCLTTNVALPILRSVYENASETWSLNRSEIMVNGVDLESAYNDGDRQTLLARFRAPFDFVPPLGDKSSLNHVSIALAHLTAQVSSVAFSCSCLKLNQPRFAIQGCSRAFKIMEIHSGAQPAISGRVIQIASIATIQEALCCSDASDAKTFFSRYHRHIRLDSVWKRSKEEVRIEFVCDNQGTSMDKHSLQLDNARCVQSADKTPEKVIRRKAAFVQHKCVSVAASQLSYTIPDLPAEIIRFVHRCRSLKYRFDMACRKFRLTSSSIRNWRQIDMEKFLQ